MRIHLVLASSQNNFELLGLVSPRLGRVFKHLGLVLISDFQMNIPFSSRLGLVSVSHSNVSLKSLYEKMHDVLYIGGFFGGSLNPQKTNY